MKLEENLIYNEDGSVKATVILSEEQKTALIQFALNFLVSAGLASQFAIMTPDDDEKIPQQFDA